MKKILIKLEEIKKELLTAKDDIALFKLIVNLPFKYKLEVTSLSLGFMALTLVNKKTNTINRITITDNELAEGTKKISAMKFEDLKIPMDSKVNILVKAVNSGKYYITSDWKYLLDPLLPAKEARFNQAAGGVGISVVFPFSARAGGAILYHYYQNEVDEDQYNFMQAYTKLVDEVLRKFNIKTVRSR